MAKLCCKVVENNKSQVYVEVMADNLSVTDERILMDKIQDLAEWVAKLKGLTVEKRVK